MSTEIGQIIRSGDILVGPVVFLQAVQAGWGDLLVLHLPHTIVFLLSGLPAVCSGQTAPPTLMLFS